MNFNMWFIFASLLLVSVGASRYDQGPQRFYDVTSDSETTKQNDNNEVILYLTPEQVRALEADGAVVQSDDSENDESESEPSAEPKVNEEEDLASEQDETESAQEEEEAQEEEQENIEDIQNQNIDFEEILRILNQDQQDEEEAEEAVEEQARSLPQVEEDNTESLRSFSPRITLRQQLEQQQQQKERYLAPAVAKKEQILKSYSLTRYQPNEQRQWNNVRFLKQQEEEANEAEESSSTQEKKKYKLIPYEALENPASQDTAEEQVQNAYAEDDAQRLNELISALVNSKTFTGANVQRRTRLQSVLRKMKSSPKYNNQKYAFEIERFMANSEKQNAASKVEIKTRVPPTLRKQQLDKKGRLDKSKQGKGPARSADSQKNQQSKLSKSTVTSGNTRSIAVPVIKAEKPSQRSIAVPVETSQRISVRNLYVRARTDKPYTISRRVSENKKQNPVNPRK